MDGVLGAFKVGPFKMACAAGALVVPVSVVNTAWSMPTSALLPIRRAGNIEVVVHPPIDTKGRDAGEVCNEAKAAVSAGLADWMKSRDDDSS